MRFDGVTAKRFGHVGDRDFAMDVAYGTLARSSTRERRHRRHDLRPRVRLRPHDDQLAMARR